MIPVSLWISSFFNKVSHLVSDLCHEYTHTQLFKGPLSGTTRVSRYQKKHSPTRTHEEEEEGFAQDSYESSSLLAWCSELARAVRPN